MSLINEKELIALIKKHSNSQKTVENKPSDYYSVQSRSKQKLAPNRWSVIYFPNVSINSNDGGGADRIINGDPDFEIKPKGRFLMAAYVRLSGSSKGQILSRFVREYDTTKDSFGTDEKNLTPGNTTITPVYPVGLSAGRRIALELYNGSSVDLTVEIAQFKCLQVQ